eukprot:12178192-Prorocentrum_lima.AAC.1
MVGIAPWAFRLGYAPREWTCHAPSEDSRTPMTTTVATYLCQAMLLRSVATCRPASRPIRTI